MSENSETQYLSSSNEDNSKNLFVQPEQSLLNKDQDQNNTIPQENYYSLDSDETSEQNDCKSIDEICYDKQNQPSLFFISWLKPLISYGLENNLKSSNLPQQPLSMSSNQTFIDFITIWQKSFTDSTSDLKSDSSISASLISPNTSTTSTQSINTPNTLWITFRAFWIPVLASIFGEFGFYCLSLTQPSCVKMLSHYFERLNGNESVSAWEGYFYASLLGFVAYLSANFMLIRHQSHIHWSARASNSLLTILFDKTLRIAPYAMTSSNDKENTEDSSNNSKSNGSNSVSSNQGFVSKFVSFFKSDTKSKKHKKQKVNANKDAINLSSGNITNLVSQDSLQTYTYSVLANQLWSAPFSAFLCVALMYTDLGSTSFIVMLLMLLLVPYQLVVVKIQRHYRTKTLQVTDERIKYTTQLLNGIRMIKLYGWEEALSEHVSKIRDIELYYQRMSLFWKFSSNMFTYLYPLGVTFISLAYYSRYNDDFRPEKVFLLLSYLNAMRIPIQYISSALQASVEMSVSMKRVGYFLSQEELPISQQTFTNMKQQHQLQQQPSYQEYNSSILLGAKLATEMPTVESNGSLIASSESPFINSSTSSVTQQSLPVKNIVVNVQNCDFYWSSFSQVSHSFQLPILSNICLTLHSGELKTVISHSGRGSTALLTGILGELYPTTHRSITPTLPQSSNLDQHFVTACDHGEYSFTNTFDIIPSSLITINGKNAYCAQSPFLLADSLRNNIILELPFDAVKFARVIEASALGPDLAILPDGMHSMVSEAGVSLSGGQQARVAFARVLYHADIVDLIILDDIFAAVDALVARTMFFKGVRGILKDKAVLLAINSHYDFLQYSSQVVVLDYDINTSDSHWEKMFEYYQSQHTLVNYQSSSSSSSSFDNTVNAESEGVSSSLLFDGDVQISKLNKKKYKSPSTIVFEGTFDELMKKNIDLLEHFTPSKYSQEESSSELFTDTYEGTRLALQMAEFGAQGPETGAIASAQGVVESNTSSSGPSQAQLPFSLYYTYIAGSHTFKGLFVLSALVVVLSILSQVGLTFTDLWLVHWSNNATTVNPTTAQLVHPYKYWMYTTGSIMLLTALIFLFQSLVFLYIALNSSKHFHKQALYRVFHATIVYLDTTPMGQIVNRFTKDMQTVDQNLPDNFLFLVQQLLIFSGILVLSLMTSYLLIIPLIPLFFITREYRKGFYALSIQLKRLESASLTPIFTLFTSVLRGNATIRAYNLQQHFIQRYRSLVDKYSQIKFLSMLIERRFSYQLNVLAAFYIWFLGVSLVALYGYIDTDLGLLALTYSLRLIGLVQMVIRLQTQTSQSMTSIQRLQALDEIPQEPAFYTPDHIKLMIKRLQPDSLKNEIRACNDYIRRNKQENHHIIPIQYDNDENVLQSDDNSVETFQQKHQKELYYWPWKGTITFNNVCLRYRPELPIVLNNLSFTIAPGQTVGLVGRSGAGKSSLLQALFRMIEPASGCICIDGVNIHDIGIGDLRSRLSIVPQSPTLFSGTIRSNLDPLSRFSDQHLWHALSLCSMVDKVHHLEDGLNSTVQENGSNFSASERQLLCIARALLLQSANTQKSLSSSVIESLPGSPSLITKPSLQTGSILVADEMTSSIPNDYLIQQTIRQAFSHCTMLIIAHRLNTVVDLDRILVIRPLSADDIAQGRSSLVEFGVPLDLLNDPTSEFYTMCKNTGHENFNTLYKKAELAYKQTIEKEAKKGFPAPSTIRS